MRARVTTPLVAAALLLGGCDVLGGGDEEEVTLFIGPMLTTCYGPFERECMLVKESQEAEYELFYDAIQGFTYEPGFSYVVRAAWKSIPNPPQDASSREYRLIRVESKIAAPR